VVELIALVFIAAAGFSTILGAIPLAVIRQLTHKSHDTILGFVAGVMLGIAILDLLIHVPEHSGEQLGLTAISIIIGMVVIIILIRTVRRIPLPMPFVRNQKMMNSSMAFLLFLALAIHNAPEGLATGVGYSQGLTTLGHSIAIAIALHNIPEGLLISISVLKETGSRRAGFGYAALSGVVEPVAGFIAFFFLTMSPEAFGMTSAFAAGAMLSVVIFQMIPESHRHGYHVSATLALFTGFAIVAVMNLLFGLY